MRVRAGTAPRIRRPRLNTSTGLVVFTYESCYVCAQRFIRNLTVILAFFGRRAPLLALFLLAVTVTPARAQPSVPWWKSDQFRKEVGITAEQGVRIDSVFQSALPKLRQAKQDLDEQEAELSKLIEANADDAAVMRQVDRVESFRGMLNKQRTVMLLRMRQVLSPEQRKRFRAAHDQWEKEHRRARGR